VYHVAISQTGLYFAFANSEDVFVVHGNETTKVAVASPKEIIYIEKIDIVECREDSGISGYCIAIKDASKVHIRKIINDKIVFKNILFLSEKYYPCDIISVELIESVAFIPDTTQIIIVAQRSIKVAIADWSKIDDNKKILDFNWMAVSSPTSQMTGVENVTYLIDCDLVYVRYSIVHGTVNLLSLNPFDRQSSILLEAMLINYKNGSASVLCKPLPHLNILSSSPSEMRLKLLTNNSALNWALDKTPSHEYMCVESFHPSSYFRHLDIMEMHTGNIVDIVCCSEGSLFNCTELVYESF
jgi:hypothetical protein